MGGKSAHLALDVMNFPIAVCLRSGNCFSEWKSFETLFSFFFFFLENIRTFIRVDEECLKKVVKRSVSMPKFF